MSLSANPNCKQCGKAPVEPCRSIICPRPRTEADLAELRAWLEQKVGLEGDLEIGAGAGENLRPDARTLFDAFEVALVEGTPTLSLRDGRLWVDDAAFDARAILALLQAAREEAYKEGWNDREDDLIAGVNRIAPEEASQGAGEPVAWRVKDFADGWFFYGKNQEAEATRAQVDGFLVQPLYRSPPTDPRTKALEEALRPFAAFADNVDQDGWTSNIHREGISVWFGPSDFRAAQAALSPVQAVKGDEHG